VVLGDIAVSLARADLERLMTALAATLPSDQPRPDSPARLTAALAAAIAQADGVGEPTVTRRPAGLATPESWQIHIAGADDRTRAVVAALTGERGR
jgi:hypothetical protein